MAGKVNIGLLVPSVYIDGLPPPDRLASFFQAADRLGFHSLWVTERLLHRLPVIQPLTTLSMAAAVTSNIGLGTAVVLASLRHPIHLANEAANLDYLSGGRLSLGISLGGRPEEFEALGIPIRRRKGRLEETIELLRKLWSESQVSYQGRHFKVENASITSRPVRSEGIPIFLAGGSEPALRRAATQSDGWVHGSQGTPEEMAQRCQAIRTYAAEAGRDAESLELGKLIYIAIDDNKDRAKARLEPWLHAYYGPQYDVNRFCAMGTPQECAAYVTSYIDAGVTMPVLGLSGPDVAELERLHGEVLPLLG